MTFLTIEYRRKYFGTKKGQISRMVSDAKFRAKRKGLPFDITTEYIESIATDKCPIFHTDFVWGASGKGVGINRGPHGPSLDRVIPSLGYVEGNVVFISMIANRIKNDATEKELYAVADWLHDKRKEVLNAFRDKLPRLPESCVTPGRKAAAPGAIHGPGPRQDCDGAQHYQTELFGTDPGGCT